MAERRILTIEQVNKLVPRLNLLVAEQLERRRSIDQQLKDLTARLGHLPSELTLDPGDTDDVRRAKTVLAGAAKVYEDGWRELERMGGVLKDPRLGLVDFYGKVDGELVWLCWRYGEPAVTHFHALDEGFAKRRPLPEVGEARPLFN